MARTKNQNIFHATKDGKRTVCGLSNQWKDADTVEVFVNRIKNSSYTKFCCVKCESGIKVTN